MRTSEIFHIDAKDRLGFVPTGGCIDARLHQSVDMQWDLRIYNVVCNNKIIATMCVDMLADPNGLSYTVQSDLASPQMERIVIRQWRQHLVANPVTRRVYFAKAAIA